MTTAHFAPLWLEGKKNSALSKTTSIGLPDWLDEEEARQEAAKRVLALGFNTLILGAITRPEGVPAPFTSSADDLMDLCGMGLRVGLKPSFHIDQMIQDFSLSPFNSKFRDFLKREIAALFLASKAATLLVYESLSLLFDEMGLNQDDEHLFKEIATHEIALLEEILPEGVDLLYLFPGEDAEVKKREALNFKDIALKASKRTRLVISAREGNPFHDHLNPHPLLLQGRNESLKGFSSAAIVNLGGIQQGGGLWPSFPLDIYQHIYPMLFERNITPLPIVPAIPGPGSLLEAALKLASISPESHFYLEMKLAEWLKEMRRETDTERALTVMRGVREIAVDLSRMRTALSEAGRDQLTQEECKLLASSLYYSIRKVQRECGRTAQTKEGSLSLQHYVHFFSLDAFRTLLHFIQSFNVVLQETLELGAGQKGFWTDFAPGTGSGLRSMGKVTFLKSPAVDVNSPEMVSILKESGYSLTQTETT